MKPLRFLYWIGNPNSLGAERFIYLGWKHAILSSGHFFYELTNSHLSWDDRINETKPDIIFLTNYSNLAETAPVLREARRRGCFVFMVVAMPFPERYLQAIREYDPADIYFGEREPDSMSEFVKATQKPYVLIPNAADRLLHFPTPPIGRYDFDIVFLGNRRTQKSKIFESLLIPLMLQKKYRVGIFGPFWSKSDYALAGVQKIFQKIGLHSTAKIISNARISVPFDQENAFYSSAKICLNFHEREDDGTQPHHIVNMRAFKIAACGGFQLCDRVLAMPKYFEENNQIIMADDNAEFLSKIDYYIGKEKVRESIKTSALERACKEHTYHNRLDLLLNIYFGKGH